MVKKYFHQVSSTFEAAHFRFISDLFPILFAPIISQNCRHYLRLSLVNEMPTNSCTGPRLHVDAVFPPRDIIEQQRLHFARLLSSGHTVKWSQILLVRGIRIHRQIYSCMCTLHNVCKNMFTSNILLCFTRELYKHSNC